jgi:hypothetical protein
MIKLKDILTEAPKKNKWKVSFTVEIPEDKRYHYLYNKVYKSFLSGYEKYENWKVKKLIIKQ